MRIVAGKWGGRRLRAPRGRHTRPTADHVREGIFNVLAHQGPLQDAVVWDLYAGTGALGIEALSRGAAQAAFVESHGATAAVIRANLSQLGAPPAQARVVVASVERWLPRAPTQPPATLLLLDPPYSPGVSTEFLEALAHHAGVAQGAWIVVEGARGKGLRAVATLELLQVKVYGDSEVSFFRKSPPGEDAADAPQPPGHPLPSPLVDLP